MSESTPFLTDPIGRQHLLAGESTTIGRAVENEIVIASKRVSRVHARIRRAGQQLLVEDLGSTNGTFLNGERVLAPVDLRDGDQITVGDVLFILHDPEATFCDTPFPELEIDEAAGVVRVDRQLVSLSPKEFLLLAHLNNRRGEVCSKDEIGAAVWPEYEEGVYDYQVENLVRRLRTRIEVDPAEPQLLVTVRGLGYKLVG
ncbi:MAG: FHA domain-containing protein [Anaerolineae bacterium]|nr:FHA domain-containing protein [Anaerolineae bacterium]